MKRTYIALDGTERSIFALLLLPFVLLWHAVSGKGSRANYERTWDEDGEE